MEQLEMEPERAEERWRIVSWWMTKSRVERYLIGLLIMAVLIIIYLLIVVVASIQIVRPHCETEICIQQAATLIASMNKTIDPCDDFYEFACGRYIEETLIPENEIFIYPAGRIEDLIEIQLQTLISQPSLPTDIDPYFMLRKLYDTCMDTNAIEKSGLDQMKLLLKMLGGWPILEKDNWVEIDWINITQKIRRFGFPTNQFIGIDTEVNTKNPTEYVIRIAQWHYDEIGSIALAGGHDALFKKYTDFLVKLAGLFGAQREFAKKEVDAVIKFREKLARALESEMEHRRLWIHGNISTIEQIQVQYPSIPWLDVLNAALAIPNVTLTKRTQVAVISATYITEFAKIIKETPKRVQANHALFQIIRSHKNCLPTVIQHAEDNFYAYTVTTRRKPVRWRTCLNMVTQHFGVAVDALYIRKYRNDNAKKDVTEMVSNIKNVFINRLKKVEWMDDGTKVRAIEKAEVMSANIAYPDELHNERNIADFYKGLKFDANSLLALVTQISKFNRDKKLSLYRNPVEKNHWTLQESATTSNAFYDTFENSIYIPFGIMKNEFYRFGRPMYMNYGGIGFVVAHEMTHGFDNHGKSFNQLGEVIDWWSTSVNDRYDAKARCFVEQYNNFAVPGTTLYVDGNSSLPENIADNGGIKDAYLAYLAWKATHRQELPLPGLDLTDQQLFWVSYANAWCAKQTIESLEAMVLGGQHPPFRFRILGSLRNTDYFSEDFNCPLGSNMNPVKKCQVW